MAKPDRKPDPDFEPDYDVADADYDEAPQASLDEGADPDYDEARQVEYEPDFSVPEEKEGTQEWYARKQK